MSSITEERLKKIASSLHKKQLKSNKSKNPTLSGLGSLIHPRLKLTEVCTFSGNERLYYIFTWNITRVALDLEVESMQ